jgi:hypothetical protein
LHVTTLSLAGVDRNPLYNPNDEQWNAEFMLDNLVPAAFYESLPYGDGLYEVDTATVAGVLLHYAAACTVNTGPDTASTPYSCVSGPGDVYRKNGAPDGAAATA